MDLRYFNKKNKPDFNFISPKIRRYITTQNTLHFSLPNYRFLPKRTKTKTNENLQTNKTAVAAKQLKQKQTFLRVTLTDLN